MEMVVGRKITTREAATILGITLRAVQKRIEAGKLRVEMFGTQYQLDEDEIREVARLEQERKQKRRRN